MSRRKKQNQAQEIATTDSFSNPLFRLGYGSQSPLEAASYPLTRMSNNYALLNSLYRDNWVVQNVVGIIPDDMTRKWYTLQGPVSPRMLEELERAQRAISLKDRINEGLRWGRLYGGAAGLLLIRGQEDRMDTPLDLESVLPGTFAGIYILDRWSGISPEMGLVTDIRDPDFGLPEYYNISSGERGFNARVHHSRIIRFTGRELPYLEKLAEMYWGESEVESLYQDVVKHDSVAGNMAALTFRANLDTMEVENLDQLFSTTSQQQQRRFWNTMQAQSVMRSNFGMQLVNRGDKITNQYVMKRLVPLIGHMKLKDIRPQHINKLEKELAKEGVRNDPASAKPKEGFRAAVYDKFPSQRALAAAAGISKSVMCECCQGKQVLLATAEKVASAMGEDVNRLFEIIIPDAPLAGNTLSRYHCFITSVLRQAEREMLIPYNPGLKVAPPKIEKKEPNYFQPEIVARIMEALESEPIRWRALIHVFIVTGCRRGEVLALKWDKIDFEKRRIRIDASVDYIPGHGMMEGKTKTRRSRYVYIPEETATLLQKYRIYQTEIRLQNAHEWHDEGYVFTRDNGLPQFTTTLANWLNAFSKRHGLPHINPHSFRHTAASIMIAEGVDVVTVSKMLGHANTTITMNVYSHAIESAERAAAECISSVILRKKKA